MFDFYSFYDSCVFDLKHFLSIKIKSVIQILKMLKTTFNDVLIEQNDDDSKELIFETFFKKIDELIIELIDFQIDLKNAVNSILEEMSQLITFEMTFDRDVDAMNDQVHIVVLSVSKIIDQIEIAIQKISQRIQISSKSSQHFSISSIFDVQIRFESMNRQARFDLSNFKLLEFDSFNLRSSRRTKAKSLTDFVTMNTRSQTRKQTYATTLIIVNQLSFYFATFSIELQCSNIISVVLKLHKDDYRLNRVIDDKLFIIVFLKNFSRLQSRK